MPRHLAPLIVALLLLASPAAAQVEIDREAREVRVACEALRVDMPLEYVCVVAGTADHESLLRTRAVPSAIHAGLLALGLEPGRPLRFNEAAQRWIAPSGPPVRIEVEWEQDGRTRRERVGRLVRGVETGEPMPPRTFVFVGSRPFDDGYAADATGQVVSLVNFEYPVLDVGELASSANETLEWETDPDAAPPAGTAVTMILSPIGDDPAPATRPATRPSPADLAAAAGVPLMEILDADEVRLDGQVVSLDTLPARVAALGRKRIAFHLPPGVPDHRLRTAVYAASQGGATQILHTLALARPVDEPAGDGVGPPPAIVLVKIDADGTVAVDRRVVDVEDVAAAVLASAVPGRDRPAQVRLSAVESAPLAAVGGVFGRLTEAGIDDVRFVPPPEVIDATTRPAQEIGFERPPRVTIEVGDGGREVMVSDSGDAGRTSYALGVFVDRLDAGGDSAPEDLEDKAAEILIRPAVGASDVAPVDLAAPAAALHVLGYRDVTVEYPDGVDDLDALRRQWQSRVLPQTAALREAAQTHYEVMRAYQDRINALLEQADELRREMDELQTQFDDLTTPRPTLGD